MYIHFHSNGEDIGQLVGFAEAINSCFDADFLAMEYPGYGLYSAGQEGKHKAEAIIEDARLLVNYATIRLGYEQRNIILSGRSMGSGPASILAA